MKIAARYIWGKTEKGYGWLPWQPPQLAIEREWQSGFWNVYDADGSLLCRCVDYRSAQKVIGRVRHAEQSMLVPESHLDFALLTHSKEGWTYSGYALLPAELCNSGKTFPTREDAEAYIRAEERIFENGKCVSWGHS